MERGSKLKKVLTVVGIFIFSVVVFLGITDMCDANSSRPIRWAQYVGSQNSVFESHDQLQRLTGAVRVDKAFFLAADTAADEGDDGGEDPGAETEDKDGEKDSNRFWGAAELG